MTGARHKDLAAKFGINRETVSVVLRRRGLTWERGLTPGQVEEAARLYLDEGWSLARIGDKFGYHAGTVRKALLDAGVKTRPRTW